MLCGTRHFWKTPAYWLTQGEIKYIMQFCFEENGANTIAHSEILAGISVMWPRSNQGECSLLGKISSYMTTVIASVAAFCKLFRPFLLILKRKGKTFNAMVFTVSLVFSHSLKSIFWIKFLEICNISTQNRCKAFQPVKM